MFQSPRSGKFVSDQGLDLAKSVEWLELVSIP